MNNKVKKRKHRCDFLAGSCCGDGPFCTCPKPVLKCKCGKVRPLNNKVEG